MFSVLTWSKKEFQEWHGKNERCLGQTLLQRSQQVTLQVSNWLQALVAAARHPSKETQTTRV